MKVLKKILPVVAIALVLGVLFYGGAPVMAAKRPKPVSNLTVSGNLTDKGYKVVISWDPVEGTSGYEVSYKSASDDKVLLYRGSKKTTLSKTLARGTAYTFYVRSYFKTKGKRVYSKTVSRVYQTETGILTLAEGKSSFNEQFYFGRVFRQNFTGSNYTVYFDDVDVTKYSKATTHKSGGTVISIEMKDELSIAEHTYRLCVDGFEEYTDTFIPKHFYDFDGAFAVDEDGKYRWGISRNVAGEFAYIMLNPTVYYAQKEGKALEIYIDEVKLKRIGSYGEEKLGMNDVGSPLWIDPAEISIEKGSTHHVKVICEGMPDSEADILF